MPYEKLRLFRLGFNFNEKALDIIITNKFHSHSFFLWIYVKKSSVKTHHIFACLLFWIEAAKAASSKPISKATLTGKKVLNLCSQFEIVQDDRQLLILIF